MYGFSSRGMKTARAKSKKFRKTDLLLSKVRIVEICPLAILMPLEEDLLLDLIRKLSLVVKNLSMGRGVAVL